MFGHAGLIGWGPSGSVAVDVFFALSGWLIGGILLKTPVMDLPRFYFNRAVRIWVPYYVALVLLLTASILKDPVDGKWLEFVIYKVTWVYNLFGSSQLKDCRGCMPLDGTGNHFWSVNAEEQFYLLAPLLLVALVRPGRWVITWIALASALLLLKSYAAISFGVLMAVINSRYPEFYLKTGIRIILLSVLLLAMIGMAIRVEDYRFFSPFFSISLVLLIALTGKRQSFGAILGGMSYPLYLNHWIGVFMANALLDPFGIRGSGLGYFLATIFNYGIAFVLFMVIDKRILFLRGGWYNLDRGLMFTFLAYALLVSGMIYGLGMNYSIHGSVLLSIFLAAAVVVVMRYRKAGFAVLPVSRK